MPGLRERGPDRMPVHLGHRCSLRRSQLALGLSGRNNELHPLLLALQLSLHPLRLPGLGSSLLQERSQGYKTHRRHSNRICSSAASTFLLLHGSALQFNPRAQPVSLVQSASSSPRPPSSHSFVLLRALHGSWIRSGKSPHSQVNGASHSLQGIQANDLCLPLHCSLLLPLLSGGNASLQGAASEVRYRHQSLLSCQSLGVVLAPSVDGYFHDRIPHSNPYLLDEGECAPAAHPVL